MGNLIKKICENCNKEFYLEYRMRGQKCCCKKCANEKSLVDRITLEQNCPKCGEKFEIKITKSEYKRNKYKKYCSRKCSNGHVVSEDLKKKISESCKNSEKVKIANSVITENRKRAFDEGRNKRRISKSNDFICEHCGELGIDKKGNKNRRYHAECWLKISGGLKEGSSRGKHGWYKGYWCDSSYELAFLIYCLEHNIKIERNKKYFEYSYEGKKYKFYPDFRVNDVLTEIKNFRSELTSIKLESVNEKIDIFYKDTIKPYLDYVKNKYGKDFIKLYENGNSI